MIGKKEIHPLGIGTFKLDLADRNSTMRALQYSFDHGQNFIDTSYLYENGENITFLADFFNVLNRENIFIITSIEKFVENPMDIEAQLDNYLKMMGLDYVDCLQLHEPAATKIPLIETFESMNQMVKKGKTRFLGASNLNSEDLRLIHDNFKLFHFSGAFNLECKAYEEIGAVNYCSKNDVLFIAYQALRRNRTAGKNYPVLVELAQKYGKTQNQIILNWIVKEKKTFPLVKAGKIENIKENLAALDFEMDEFDMKKLNDFNSPEFESVNIDWKNKGNGVVIHQLPNQFE